MITYTVKETQNILQALKILSPQSSKESLRSWIRLERVFLNGRLVKDSRQLADKGQVLSVGKKQQYLAKNIKIVFEDRHLIVLDKPCGLLSVADEKRRFENLHDLLKEKRPRKKIFVIHRLDRETSGLILFAFQEQAANILKEELEKRHVKREYRAIIEGQAEKEKGKWQSFLYEDKNFFVHSSPDPKRGKKATSLYQTLAKSPKFSYLRIELESGRKNQIRAQCFEQKHPVAGDLKYGAKKNPIKRLALHAHRLSFLHPIEKKNLQFYSPLPEIFFTLIDRMEKLD